MLVKVRLRYRGGVALAALLACLPLGSANADDSTRVSAKKRGATLVLSSGTGAPGDVVRVVGRRFPRSARVRITFAGRRVLSVRAGRRGAFKRRFAVPRRSSGRYRLVARTRGVRLTIRFRIVTPTTPPVAAPIAAGPDSSTPPGASSGQSSAPAAPAEPPTLVAAGDIACEPSRLVEPTWCHHSETASLVESLEPDAVATLGDNQYTAGTWTEFQGSYNPTWGRFKSITHPAIGDEEYEADEAATGYFDYFNGIGSLTGPAGNRQDGYYRWTLGSWTLFVLNSGAPGGDPTDREDCWPVSCDENSQQLVWLQDQLEALPDNSCAIAYWHHPRYSSGANNTPQSHFGMRHIFTELYEHGVEIALNGHAHNYERFKPLTPGRVVDEAGGVRQFVVGTGGRSVYPDKPTQQQAHVTSDRLITHAFGVLELTLSESSYSWRFVPEPGTVLDRPETGSASCH